MASENDEARTACQSRGARQLPSAFEKPVTLLPVVFPGHSQRIEQEMAALNPRCIRSLPPLSVSILQGSLFLLQPAGDSKAVLIDGRPARPSQIRRAIARLRFTGWSGPVLLLIDERHIKDMRLARALGASDFITSFSPSEVERRIRRLLERASPAPSRLALAARSVSRIRIDRGRSLVHYEDVTVPLSCRELQLFEVFLAHAGKTLSGEEIALLAWQRETIRGDNVAAAYVCALRKKLAWFGNRFGIRTVRGRGYCFELPKPMTVDARTGKPLASVDR